MEHTTPKLRTHRIYTEIQETPLAIQQTLAAGEAALGALVGRFHPTRFGALAGIGCGSSYFAALTLRYAMQQLCGMAVHVWPSLDFRTYAGHLAGEGWLVVAFSQSGETRETVEAAWLAAGRRARVLAVTNAPGSQLAQVADGVLALKAGEERTAGTKTVVAQGLAACQFALAAAEGAGGAGNTAGGARARAIQRCREGLQGAEAAARRLLAAEAALAEMAQAVAACEHLFIVGPGPMYPLALQAANSMKEIGKVHAEGFEVSEFRHGPLEYVQPGHVVVVLAHSESPLLDEAVWAARLAGRAGARVVVVHDGRDRVGASMLEAAESNFEAPHLGELVASAVWLTLFHLLGYHIALHKGLDPDRFRNIVKTWTTRTAPGSEGASSKR